MTGHNNIISTDGVRRSREDREYGRNGMFGILTPPANPTVEPELDILLPVGSTTLTARLISDSPSLRERLIGYLANLPITVGSFGDIAFDAVAFACTGSSYLIDPLEERRIVEAIEDAKNYEVVTAARAVWDSCDFLGIRRIALMSPYPEWLTAACRSHWERKGLAVTAVLQLSSGGSDHHGIYALRTPTILSSAMAFQVGNADAILVAGTGMPSLRTILALEARRAIPVLSSNLCLAWSLAKRLGAAPPGGESRLYGGWSERLARA